MYVAVGRDARVWTLELYPHNRLLLVNPRNGSVQSRIPLSGDAVQTPVVGPDGTVYLFQIAPKFLFSWEPQLSALTPSGTVLWTCWLGPADVSAGSPSTVGGTFAPALGANGTVYAAFLGQGLSAVSSSDGRLKWTLKIPVRADPVTGPDGTVYVGTDNGLAAVSPAGSVKWTFSAARGETVVRVAPDGTVYTLDHHYLFALTPAGKEKWRLANPLSAPVVARDGTVYLCSDYLSALTPDGKEKWTVKTGFAPDGDTWGNGPLAIGFDGTIYVAGKDSLYAFDPGGKTKWRLPLKGASLDVAPVVSPDGTIYVVGGDGAHVYAVGEPGR
jgi:outer membrane protein assembly factor BamB